MKLILSELVLPACQIGQKEMGKRAREMAVTNPTFPVVSSFYIVGLLHSLSFLSYRYQHLSFNHLRVNDSHSLPLSVSFYNEWKSKNEKLLNEKEKQICRAQLFGSFFCHNGVDSSTTDVKQKKKWKNRCSFSVCHSFPLILWCVLLKVVPSHRCCRINLFNDLGNVCSAFANDVEKYNSPGIKSIMLRHSSRVMWEAFIASHPTSYPWQCAFAWSFSHFSSGVVRPTRAAVDSSRRILNGQNRIWTG